MSKKPNRLTPAVRQRMLSAIRSGGYPHVAAESMGIPVGVLDEWLKKGQAPKARAPYVTFAQEVNEAHAQARLKAEMQVFEKEPKVWLENGPGRERPGSRGWTSTVKPPEVPPAAEANPWLQPEFVQALRRLLEVLAPFPEARRHAAQVLATGAAPSPPNPPASPTPDGS